MRIGLIAAMPEECRPLLKRVNAYEKVHIERFPCFLFTAAGNDVCLIRSGMGGESAAEATGALIDSFRPELIISFGFGGGVLPGLTVGDLVMAERLLLLRDGHFAEQAGLDAEQTESARRLLAAALPHAAARIRSGSFITTGRIETKRNVAESLPGFVSNPILEMETCAVARVASAAGVRLLAVRAVSDAAGEELGFDLAEFCDAELNIRAWRVLLTLVRKPGILPQLLRLARNSLLAGKRLAEGVLALLEMNQGEPV